MLPSPEELKNKILVKAKKINLKSTDSVDTDAEMVDEEDVEDRARLGKMEEEDRARLGKLSLREVFQHSGESEDPPRSGDWMKLQKSYRKK